MEAMLLGNSFDVQGADQAEFMSSAGDISVMRSLSAIPMASLMQKSLDGAIGALWFDDEGEKPAAEFQAEWQELLRASNLLQFVPRFACFTRRMMHQGGLGNLVDWLLEAEEIQSTPGDDNSALTPDQWEELELLDRSLQPILIPLLKTGAIPWPQIGYEGTSDTGQCSTAMLEAAWPELKTGIAIPENMFSTFEALGWKILPAEGLTPAALLSTFNPPA